jgi:hypothetical protein
MDFSGFWLRFSRVDCYETSILLGGLHSPMRCYRISQPMAEALF